MTKLNQLVSRAVLALLVSASASFANAASIGVAPDSGSAPVGSVFVLQISVSGLDSAHDLYDYSFDLAFDPAVFKVVSATDGTVFNGGLYTTGVVDNFGGNVIAQGGLDLNQSFTGTNGVLGVFALQVLKVATGSQISVVNVGLQTFTGALSLQNDIDAGQPSVAVIDTVSGSAVPEPRTEVLSALLFAAVAWDRRRSVQRRDK
jgi:hypothetical protein